MYAIPTPKQKGGREKGHIDSIQSLMISDTNAWILKFYALEAKMEPAPSADQEEISRPSRKSVDSTKINFSDDPKCKKGEE